MADPRISFEQMLRDAAEKRAEVRVKPIICPRTGSVLFVAHLHGVPGKAEDYYCNGLIVMPRPNSQAVS